MSCSQGSNETVKYLLQNKLISDINAKTKVFMMIGIVIQRMVVMPYC